MLEDGEAVTLLARHVRGDFGEIDEADRKENDRAVNAGCRVFSAYTTRGGATVWIISEANRQVTPILLPEEY